MLLDLLSQTRVVYIQGSQTVTRPLNRFLELAREHVWEKLDFQAGKEAIVPALMTSMTALALGTAAYMFGDGVGQAEQPTTAEIIATRYQPPYTTQSCSTNADGIQSCTTIYHPEEYHAKIQIPQSPDTTSIQVSSSEYKELKQAAEKRNVYYVAEYREGRWSHKAVWIDLSDTLQKATPEQIKQSRLRPIHDATKDQEENSSTHPTYSGSGNTSKPTW